MPNRSDVWIHYCSVIARLRIIGIHNTTFLAGEKMRIDAAPSYGDTAPMDETDRQTVMKHADSSGGTLLRGN